IPAGSTLTSMTSSLRPVADHQHHLADLLARTRTTVPEPVPVARARGRVVAEPVSAPEALPAFDNSAMDGYAVRASDIAAATAEGPVRLPVGGDIPAGAPVGELPEGQALRI